jgi:hypothetical protein
MYDRRNIKLVPDSQNFCSRGSGTVCCILIIGLHVFQGSEKLEKLVEHATKYFEAAKKLVPNSPRFGCYSPAHTGSAVEE